MKGGGGEAGRKCKKEKGSEPGERLSWGVMSQSERSEMGKQEGPA